MSKVSKIHIFVYCQNKLMYADVCGIQKDVFGNTSEVKTSVVLYSVCKNSKTVTGMHNSDLVTGMQVSLSIAEILVKSSFHS